MSEKKNNKNGEKIESQEKEKKENKKDEEDIIEEIKKQQESLHSVKEDDDGETDAANILERLEGLDLNAIKEQAEQFANSINERIAKAEQQTIEYKEIAQRIQAEFDNYRKRNAYAISGAKEDGQIEVIKSILPIIDNFERAMASMKDEVDEKNYAGIEMIYKQCLEILKSNGIEEIEALGKQFDPSLHNAAMQIPLQAGQKEDEIVAVFQKGYKKGDNVIRHSMVSVAK